MFEYEVLRRLDRIEAAVYRLQAFVSAILTQEKIMSKELDALQSQVKQNGDVEASAVTLIQGLADQIKAARDEPAKLDALTAELKSKADALAAAITANTPAAPGGGGAPPPGPAPAGQARHKP